MTKNPLNAIARHLAEQRFWRWALPLLAPGAALANPTGADVVGGTVAITNTDPNTLTINQSTATAAINWQNFSVGQQEYVIFNQPSASALALNRVVGGTPSEIFGHLLANGRVFLINPNGILFGAGSRVDVGALVASTANISDADFASGRYVFNNAGTSSITNAGNIIAGPGGFVVLAADSVSNTGLIQANLGEVVLGAGNAFTLDLTGEGLINFAVDQAALSAQSGVSNLGQLVADGGKVLMTAKTAADLARTVVNNEGLVQARSISQDDKGEIYLGATGGDVVNAGTLDASGINGANGGTVSLVSTKAVKLASTSVINATGDGPLASGGGVHLSGHTVSVRGLMNIGKGGKFLLDPSYVHIVNSGSSHTGNGTSGFVGEHFLENQLKDGVDVTIIASKRITLDDLTDNVLNGVNGGASGDGGLTLAIGTYVTGSSYGGGAYGGNSFSRGSGSPGGGINFMDANDEIIVGRNLRIIAGYNYGGIDVGKLTAGGSIDLDAPNGITAGNITAGGSVQIYDGGPGDISVGNIIAGDLASIWAQDGNVTIGDITVTGDGAQVGVNITALGTTSSVGHDINAGDDTISVHNSSGHAYANINASKDVVIDKLVVHGGGGSNDSALPSSMLDVHVTAGHDLTVHAADLTTSPFHFSSSAPAPLGGHDHRVVDSGSGFASFNANGTVTLGETGVTGREVKLETAGDAHLTIGHSYDHAGVAVLNKVTVVAHAAASHEDATYYTDAYGYFGYQSYAVNFHTTQQLHHDAAVGNAQVDVYTDGNVSVPAGGAVSVTADGDAGLYVDAGGAATFDGSITIDAKGGRAYGGSTWSASSSTWSNAPLDTHGYTSYSDNNNGSADLYVAASGDIHVGGVMSVTGHGTANASIRAYEGGSNLTVDGKISVLGNKAHYQHSSSGSRNSVETFHKHESGSHGEAILSLDANSSGYVKIGPTGSLDVKDFGGANPFSEAEVHINARYGVYVEGQIHVTGSYGDFHQDYGSAHRFSDATAHFGGASLQMHTQYNEVAVYGGASVDVEGHGEAAMHAVAQYGGVVLDGPITVHTEAATYTQDQSRDNLSSYYNGSTWVPYYTHSENHGGGAYGSAFFGAGAYGGDLTIASTANIAVSGPINTRAELYAGLIGSGTPHAIHIDSGAHLSVTATAANRHETSSNDNSHPGYTNQSRTHFDGSQAYAGLELHGDGVYIGSSASVAVTAAGIADIDIVSSRGRGVYVDGTLKAIGNKAFFNSSNYYNYGYQSSNSYASGFGGEAIVGVQTLKYGSSYADFVVGSQGQVVVQDHGGAGGHRAAALTVNTQGDIVINGQVTIEGDRGWRQESGFGHSFSYTFSGSSYADAGAANLQLTADQGVYIGRSATIDVHAYGYANANLQAYNDELIMDGALTVKADRGHHDGFYTQGYGGGYQHSTFNSSYGAAYGTLYAGSGNVFLGGTSSSEGGSVTRFGSVTIQGAGEAGFDVYARYDVRDEAPVTVTTTRGTINTLHENGHYVNSGTSESPSFVPVVDSSIHQSQNAGSAYVNMHAGNWGNTGRLIVNAPVVVTGAGSAWGSLTGRGTASSAGVQLNAPLTVTDIGGARAYGGKEPISRGIYNGYATGSYHFSDGYAGYGDAYVYLGAFGSGDDIDVGTGGITISAPGSAELELYASRDLNLGGAINITATKGQRYFNSSGHENWTLYNGDHGTYDYGSNSIVNAGRAELFVDNARDLNITAPVSITGSGDARFDGSYYFTYYYRYRNVNIAAPLSVIDNGSSYKRTYNESWDIKNASSGEAWEEDYHSFSAGIAGSYAHSGGAGVQLYAREHFNVTSNGSITVRGVGYANADLENNGSPAYSYGGIRLDGHVTVSATRNDYRYHSSSHYDSPGYNYTYHSDTTSASGAAQAYLSAAGDVAIYGGLDVSGSGSADVHILARNVDIESPVTLTGHAAHFGSHWDWTSHSYGVGYDSTYNSNYDAATDSGTAQLYIGADRNIKVGAGGISVTAHGGSAFAALYAGSGYSGDININAPITVRSASPGTSTYTQHTDSHYVYPQSSTSFSSNYNGNWKFGEARLTLNAYGYPGYGGHVTLSWNAPIDVSGYGSAGAFIYGANGVTVGAPIHVTAHAAHSFSHAQGHSHSFSNSEGQYDSYSTWSSTSASDFGSAALNIYSTYGVVDIGGALTVDGAGYAGVTLEGQTSYTGSYAAYGVNVHAPITVTAGRGFSGSSWESSSQYYTLSTTGSGSTATTSRTLTSHSFSSGHSNYSFGQAKVRVGTYMGGIRIAAPVNITAAGSASFEAYANFGNVEIEAPITVTATKGLTSGDSFYDSASPYYSYQYHQTGGSNWNSSYGVADLKAVSRYGDVNVNAALTAEGMGAARVYLEANQYNNSGSHALRINAPVTVNSGKGAFSRQSSGAYSYKLGSGSTASTPYSQRWNYENSGSPGYASFTAFAHGDILQSSEAAISVTGYGRGGADFTAYRGNIDLQAPVTVGIQGANAHQAHDGSYHSGTYTSSYAGHFDATGYGSAGVGLTAYSSGDSLAGNVALSGITVTGAGWAGVNVYAPNGTVTLNSPVSVTAGAAGFDSSDFRKTLSGTFDSTHQSNSSGSLGSAALNLNAGDDVDLSGVSLTGAGYASAYVHANGHVDLNGPITITATRGARAGSYEREYGYSGSLGYRYGSNNYHDSSAGYAGLDVYGQYGIDAGAVTLNAQGMANATFNAPYSPLTLHGAVNVSATAGMQSFGGGSSTHAAYIGYLNKNSYGTTLNGGRANLYVHGYDLIDVQGPVNISGAGNASASFYTSYAGSAAGLTIAGPVTLTSTPGTFEHFTFDRYDNGSTYSSQSRNSFGGSFGEASFNARDYYTDVNLGAVTINAAGDTSVNLVAGGVLAVGPFDITGVAGHYHHGSSYQQGGSTYLYRYDVDNHEDGGSVSFNASGPQGVTLAGLRMTGVGHFYAGLHASSGDINVAGPITIAGAAGASSGVYHASYNTSGGYQSLYGYNSSGSSGDGELNVYTNTGKINLGAVSVTGASDARVTLNAGDTVTVGGNLAVIATGKQYHDVWGGSYGGNGHSSGASAGNSHSTAGTGRLTITANNGIDLQGVTVTGKGSADGYIQAYNGAVTVHGPISVTATRGVWHGVSDSTWSYTNSSSQGSNEVYSSAYDSSAGWASLSIYGRTGVNVGAVSVTGAGSAYLGLTASYGAVNATGAINVDGGKGTFSGFSSDQFTRGSFSRDNGSTWSSSNGEARLDISGRSGVDVTGAINVTGAGSGGANASIHAASGDVTVGGAITVTAAAGHYARGGHDFTHYSASSFYNHSYGTQFTGGEAALNVYAYGGDVTLHGFTVSAESGAVFATINAGSGAVALGGPVSVTTGGPAHYNRTRNSSFASSSYAGSSSGVPNYVHHTGNSHSVTSSAQAIARLRAHGATGVTGGAITVSGFGSASASIDPGSGDLSLSGAVNVTAVRGLSAYQYSSTYDGSVSSGSGSSSAGNAYLYVNGPGAVTLAGGFAVTGDGSADASIFAPTITIGGTAAVTAHAGDEGSHAEHGDARLRISGTTVSVNDVSVSAAGIALGSIAGNTVTAHDLSAHASNGVYSDGSSVTFTQGGAELRVSGTQTSVNGIHVDGVSFGGASINGSSGVTGIHGPVSISGDYAALVVTGPSIALDQGATIAGIHSASLHLSVPGTITAGGALNVSVTSGSASATLFGSSGVTVNDMSVSGVGEARATLAGPTVTIGGTLAVNAATGSAFAGVYGANGVTINSLNVAGGSFASASISASSGAVAASGPLAVSGNAALLDIYGQTGVTMSQGATVSGGNALLLVQTPAAITTGGTLTVNATSFGGVSVSGGTGVTVAGLAVTGGSSGSAQLFASNGAVTATGNLAVSANNATLGVQGTSVTVNNVSVSGNNASANLSGATVAVGGTLAVNAATGSAFAGVYGANGVTINSLNVAGGSFASASISASSGAVAASGPLAVTGNFAVLDVYGQTGVTMAQGATVSGGNALLLVQTPAAITTGGTLTVNATSFGGVSVSGGTGVTVAGLAVTGGSSGSAQLFASSGAVTATGNLAVSANNATLGVQGTSVTVNNVAVTAAHSGSAFLNGANGVTVHGTVAVTLTGSSGEADFFISGTGAVTLDQGATVTAADAGLIAIDGGAMNLGALAVAAKDGVLDVNAAGALTATTVTVTTTASGAAFLSAPSGQVTSITGTGGAGSTSLTVNGIHVDNVTLTGNAVGFGGTAAFNTFVANATGTITAGSGTITAGMVGFTAGSAIDLSAGTLGIGTGTAPFGTDAQGNALLMATAGNLFTGPVVPNGAFSAPDITFGGLNLTGSAIYIKTNDVSYAGTIAINPAAALPPAGYVIHYDTFVDNAKIHVVGTLPGTPVAGDAYFDAGDFAFPGTTYVFGNSQSVSPMEIGETGTGTPSAGNGADDNFFFLTDNDVTFTTDIPTSGQVSVIHPSSPIGDYNFLPITEDWQSTTNNSDVAGNEDDKKKESLEHEQQPQTSGLGEGEEGQVDNQTSSNLECH